MSHQTERDEQLAAAVGLKPKFDSKTPMKFYLLHALTQTGKHFEAPRPRGPPTDPRAR